MPRDVSNREEKRAYIYSNIKSREFMVEMKHAPVKLSRLREIIERSKYELSIKRNFVLSLNFNNIHTKELSILCIIQ